MLKHLHPVHGHGWVKAYTLIKTVFNGWTRRNLCFYRYLPYAYRFSSLNNCFPNKQPIRRLVLRVFILRLHVFNLKELDNPAVYT